MPSFPLERALWSIGPFFASPVLLAGLSIAGVTVQELVEQTPFGLGSIDVGPASPLGPRLLAAFSAGTTISRSGSSFAIDTPLAGNGYRYFEADHVPFVEIPGRALPHTLLDALPGRPLSCLIEASLRPLREVDPMIATARLIERSGEVVLSVALDMDWVQSV